MATLVGGNLTAAGHPVGNIGLNHSRVRRTASVYSGAPADTDNIVFALLKSTDRIQDIRVSVVDNSATAGAMNVGLQKAEIRDDVITLFGGTDGDVDLFASAFVINADIAYPGTSIFEQAGTLTITSRGLPCWDLLSGVTADTGYLYAIVGDISTTVDSTIDMLVEVEYVAGD